MQAITLRFIVNYFFSGNRLDEGGGLEETFSQRRARWHLSCYGKFNSTKVKRAGKRRASTDKQAVGGKYTRSSAFTSATRERVFVKSR